MFINIGGDLKKYDRALTDLLSSPQELNSYSYVANNPLKYKDPTGESLQTFGQGVMSPLTYAYNHPGQTAATLAIGAAATIAAPVAVAVGGAALGGYAIGNAIYNAATAPDADTRDYYLGQGAIASTLTVLGIKGAGSLNGSATVANEASVLSEQAFSRAAIHSDARGHYPGLSVPEIENLARNTRANADIKVNISGPDAKQYFYDQKNNNLFINNPKQPTVFSPDRGLDYLRSAVGRDLRNGNSIR